MYKPITSSSIKNLRSINPTYPAPTRQSRCWSPLAFSTLDPWSEPFLEIDQFFHEFLHHLHSGLRVRTSAVGGVNGSLLGWHARGICRRIIRSTCNCVHRRRRVGRLVRNPHLVQSFLQRLPSSPAVQSPGLLSSNPFDKRTHAFIHIADAHAFTWPLHSYSTLHRPIHRLPPARTDN